MIPATSYRYHPYCQSTAEKRPSHLPSVLNAIHDLGSCLDPQAPHSTLKKRVKLSNEDVFIQLRQSVCFINGDSVFKTGFFIRIENQTFLLTTSDGLPEDLSHVEVLNRNGKFTVREPDSLIRNRAELLPLKLYECHGPINSQIHFLEPAPLEMDLKEGMKVYFAGYPQNKLTFHKGMISSVSIMDGIKTFTIDGTVVSGNSGGPVVVQDEGKLFAVGVILSQVINWDANDPRKVDMNSPGLENRDTQAENFDKKIERLHETFLNALSSGIGKAVDARHCYEMVDLDEITEKLEDKIESLKGPQFEIPVGSKRNGIKTSKITDILAEYNYVWSQGSKHENWHKEEKKIAVPRGKTIARGMAIGILKDLITKENLNEEKAKELKKRI